MATTAAAHKGALHSRSTQHAEKVPAGPAWKQRPRRQRLAPAAAAAATQPLNRPAAAATPAAAEQLLLGSRRRACLQSLAAGAALLLGTNSGLLSPAAASAASLATGAEQLVAASRGCVAAVSAIPGGQTRVAAEVQLGSAVVWDSLGHLATPYAPLTRVLRQSPSGEAQVFVSLMAADGTGAYQLPATVVAKDPSHELIVLQVVPPPGGLRPVTIGSMAGLRVGQDALLLGALPGGDTSVSAGVISALGRAIPASNNQAVSGVLQTDADVSSQSLGGALLDSGGRLIGMPVVSYAKPGVGRSAGVNFALPVDLLRDVVPRLIVYGSASVRR